MWQRYNFESKSQLRCFDLGKQLCCIQCGKDTILKANHNDALEKHYHPLAVFNVAKIQFWKQITTISHEPVNCFRCIQYGKDTILKANHNYLQAQCWWLIAVFNMAKIQFWKQITTQNRPAGNCFSLYSIWQKYNFESKSQPTRTNVTRKSTSISRITLTYWKKKSNVKNKSMRNRKLLDAFEEFAITRKQYVLTSTMRHPNLFLILQDVARLRYLKFSRTPLQI